MRDKQVMEKFSILGDYAYEKYGAAYKYCTGKEPPQFNILDEYIEHSTNANE